MTYGLRLQVLRFAPYLAISNGAFDGQTMGRGTRHVASSAGSTGDKEHEFSVRPAPNASIARGTVRALFVSNVNEMRLEMQYIELVAIDTPDKLDPELIDEMLGWLSDCVWANDVDLSELSVREITSAVSRHYDGGIAEFVLNTGF